ncbi:MAG TPA: hypothetical protein VNN18_13345 [Candidatus Xenobia bacterium]|nr:hypothetical protein [Candidatus Xenobia bacterium]
MADNLSKTRLDSWKEIAEYLGRDVRTVIRWEKDKGLPVHRIPGGKRHAVFAYREEIDAWLASGTPINHEDSTAPRSGARLRVIAGLAALVLLLALVGFIWFNPLRAPSIARVTFAGTTLQTWDERGRLAWTYALPRRVAPLQPQEVERRVVFADLDGDGVREILTAPPFMETSREAPAQGILYCFSPRGHLLWTYQPESSLSFGGKRFDGAWGITDLVVVPGRPADSLWVAVAHIPWWPSFVVRMDAQGRASRRFVNSGTIQRLNYLRTGSRLYLLAGGVNNEYDSSGMLAVLDAEAEAVTSPQTPGSAFHCDGCPGRLPVRYFFFPRSELHQLLTHWPNTVNYITVSPDNVVEVRTVETAEWHGPAGLYTFSPSFELLAATREDAYWDIHRKLEREGKLTHTVEKCPERVRPLTVRSWSAENGWAEVRPTQWPPPSGFPAAAQKAAAPATKRSD